MNVEFRAKSANTWPRYQYYEKVVSVDYNTKHKMFYIEYISDNKPATAFVSNSFYIATIENGEV